MGFSDDRIAEMYRTETPLRGTAKAYSGLYKREFTEEDSEIRIIKDEKKRPLLTINGLPITDWCEQKWKQLIKSQPLATTVIAFFFHRQEEKQEKTLTYPHKCLPLQANKCKLRILSNSVLIDYGNASKS